MSTNENARPDGTSGAGEKMVSAVNRQPNCTAADRRRAQRRAMSPSDYRAIADEALRTFDAVIARWLPGGKFEGREYVVRNPTRNDKRPGSFKVNRDTGQWADFATGDKGADLVSLVAYVNGTRQGPAADELAAMLGLKVNGHAATERPRRGIRLKDTGQDHQQGAQEAARADFGHAKTKAAPKPDEADSRALMPVPDDAPPPPARHSKFGAPSETWTYRDADGRALCYASRFDPPKARKEFRPLTYREGANGARSWQWQGPPEPRPLYGLNRLAAHPAAAVIVCEGEKSADAAAQLLPAPKHVAVTSLNGCKSPGKSDWARLAGRTVIIWPDADEPGAKYAQVVRGLALDAGAVSVAVLDPGELRADLPKGWDAADALAEGIDPNAVRQTIEKAIGATGSDAQRDGPKAGPSLCLTSGADIRPERVNWVWVGWLARGKLHIKAGAPGTGKTTLAMAIAAILTVGGKWPDGTSAEVGDVVVWSGEDDPADTLLPRLLAAGGDRNRVHFVGDVSDREGRRPFSPAADMALLSEAMNSLERPPALLIVDPVVSAVAGDSHKNAEVRRALQPLVDLAQRHKCAVLGISHFTKGTAGRDPVERVTGSLGFGALARVVMATAKRSDEDGGGRLLAKAKSNLGPDGGGFVYDLEPCEPSPGIETTRVLWGEALEGSARELLASAEALADPEETSALAEAKDYLLSELSAGPVSSKELLQGARELGIAERTLRRAQKELGVIAEKSGFKRGWRRRLPDGQDGQKIPNTKPWPSSQSLAIFDEDDETCNAPEDGQENRRWPSNRGGHLGASSAIFDERADDDIGEDIV